MDRYATHLEALTDAALATSGAILELGCGDYSTPVLAAFARAQGRRYLVQSSDPEWSKRFHAIAQVELIDWASWVPPAGRWGLVLLDSEQSTLDRLRRLPQLLPVADVVVMHDADAAATRPNYGAATKGWTIKMYSRYSPWTAVLTPC